MLRFRHFVQENSLWLVEGKVDDLADKNPDVPVREYAAKDPTPTKKFLPWLIGQHKQGNVSVDHPDLESTLSEFDKYKHLHGIQDHSRYSFGEVRDAVQPHIGKKLGKEGVADIEQKGMKLIHRESDKGIEVWKPEPNEAGKAVMQKWYGGGNERGGEVGGKRGTSWCIAARSKECVFHTRADPGIYGPTGGIIHVKGDDNAPYAVHPKVGHVTDRHNVPDAEVPVEDFVKKNPHLKKAIDVIHQHYESDPANSHDVLMSRIHSNRVSDDELDHIMGKDGEDNHREAVLDNKSVASRLKQHHIDNMFDDKINSSNYLRADILEKVPHLIKQRHIDKAFEDTDPDEHPHVISAAFKHPSLIKDRHIKVALKKVEENKDGSPAWDFVRDDIDKHLSSIK